MDKISFDQRRKNMAAVKSKNTKIELILRRALWNKGIRYTKNRDELPGKPDIVIRKYKIAIFCDSEFWHGKNYFENTFINTQNREFWDRKISRNIQRDIEVTFLLEQQGFTVIRFWGKDIQKNPENCVEIILNIIETKRNVHKTG